MADRPFPYSRVPPPDQPRKGGGLTRLANAVSAPIFGSRFLFPSHFSRAVSDLGGKSTAALAPEHAQWYFGRRLMLEVDPAQLTRRISDYVIDHDSIRWIGNWFLDAADWSGALAPIKASPIHKEMSEVVAADLDYRSTPQYKALRRAAMLGRPARRNGVVLSGPDQIDAYFNYCADLITSMKTHGALTRRQFSSSRFPASKHLQARSAKLDRVERDIGVAIGEDGELVRHLGGKHRTAVAQALDLPSIPVEVRLVHVGWLTRQVEETGLPPHLAMISGLERIASPRTRQTVT